MERDPESRPDLFDVKFLRDELYYYSRDENQFLRRRRAFLFCLYPDLVKARFKDPDLPAQRIVLILGLLLTAVKKLSEWLSTDALKFEEAPAPEPPAGAAALVREWQEFVATLPVEYRQPVYRDLTGGVGEMERRYQALKGPLAVAPIFLKNNKRIAALITVICVALLIFCLVEREVRRAIAPAEKLDDLYVGRPAKPTGRLIFEALDQLRLIPSRSNDPPTIPRPGPLQNRLLDLLNVDPLRLA